MASFLPLDVHLFLANISPSALLSRVPVVGLVPPSTHIGAVPRGVLQCHGTGGPVLLGDVLGVPSLHQAHVPSTGSTRLAPFSKWKRRGCI